MPYARVLVVDDVPTNLDVARGMMTPYGFTIDCAASGREAIKIIQEEKVKYDAIFMDHMMPELDGIETVKIIRSDISSKYAHSIPIIALTANAIIGNDKMFLENGFQDYLTKPIDMTKLDAILQKWVRDKEKETSPEWAPLIKKMRHDEHIAGAISSMETQEEKIHFLAQAAAFSAAGKEKPAGVPKKAEKDFPSIEGIDFAGGVKRMGNKTAVYNRILSSYAAGMPALLDKIRNFETSNLNEYKITVHGIKGASHGICANDIGQLAEALEMAAKSGDIETILAKNDGFILQTEKLIDRISEYIVSL